MPATPKRKRGNVGKVGNELEGKQLFTRAERLHYKAYKKGIITFASVVAFSDKLHKHLTNENND